MNEIAVFSTSDSLDVARIALRRYAGAFPDLRIALVAPRACLAEFAVEAVAGVVMVPDDEIAGYADVRRFLAEQEPTWVRHGRSAHWYLQQFLKLGYLTSTPSDTAFLADGDTVFSPTLLADMASDPCRLTVKKKQPAFNRLASRIGCPVSPRSCVANGGLFSRVLLPAPDALPEWFVTVMREHVLPGLPDVDFSEYQVMAACWADRLPARPIRLFRRFDLVVPAGPHDRMATAVAQALKRYDAVAIERGHSRSQGLRLGARLLYAAGYSW